MFHSNESRLFSARTRVASVAACIVALASIASASCKKTPPPGANDAAPVASVVAEPAPRGARPDGGRFPVGMFADSGAPRPHGSAPPGAAPPPPLPLASDAFEVVAIGKGYGSRIIWLQTIGSKVWLSGKNLDAFAEGDGPLVKGRDLLEKLPYKPGVHDMRVVGSYPNLFVLRTKNVNERMESPEPTVFVYAAEDNGPGTWKEAKPLGMSMYPHAFVAYRDGAMIVNGTLQGNSAPYYRPGDQGTSLLFVGPDGSVSDPKLDVHPHFMAWSADADGDTLTLIGTVAIPPKTKDGDWDASGANLLRVTKDGAKRIPIQQKLGYPLLAYGARVVEANGKALVIPPATLMGEEGWRPNEQTVFVVDGDAKPARRTISGEGCTIQTARLVGDVVYAIRDCFLEDVRGYELVRLPPSGKTERVALPSIVKSEGGSFRVAKSAADKKKAVACMPWSIVVRGTSDVWVSAGCGSGTSAGSEAPAVPMVMRLGRPQEPVILP